MYSLCNCRFLDILLLPMKYMARIKRRLLKGSYDISFLPCILRMQMQQLCVLGHIKANNGAEAAGENEVKKNSDWWWDAGVGCWSENKQFQPTEGVNIRTSHEHPFILVLFQSPLIKNKMLQQCRAEVPNLLYPLKEGRDWTGEPVAAISLASRFPCHRQISISKFTHVWQWGHCNSEVPCYWQLQVPSWEPFSTHTSEKCACLL